MARKPKQDSVQVMLAPNKMVPFDHPHIPYPDVLASLKYDGNRNFNRAGMNLSRNMLKQANPYLDDHLACMNEYAAGLKLCFDMEIFDPTAEHHGKISGLINSSTNAERIPWHWQAFVFDVLPLSEWESGEFTQPKIVRAVQLHRHVLQMNLLAGQERYVAVSHTPVHSAAEAFAMFQDVLAQGLPGIEGIMLSSAREVYQQRRVGTKGAALLKFKEEETKDARIVGVNQMRKMREGIERIRNAFGRLDTPTRNDENFTVQDNVGNLVVEDDDGKRYEIMFAGPCKANPEGWPIERRYREIWAPFVKSPESIIGRYVEFKHFPVGAKDSARSGRLVRFRPDKDHDAKAVQ